MKEKKRRSDEKDRVVCSLAEGRKYKGGRGLLEYKKRKFCLPKMNDNHPKI